MNDKKKKGVILLIIAAAILAYVIMPPLGTYRLKPGHVLCPTQDGVVAYRGARMIGGLWSRARVISQYKCTIGEHTFRVTRKSSWGDLTNKINLNGQVLYADHDAIEEI